MNNTYLLLGANLGNPLQQLETASAVIRDRVGKVLLKSDTYLSKAWGVTDQPDFLNKVLLVETTLSPQQLLLTCQAIEDELGRVRHTKWGARVIDIDILYYNDDILEKDDLTIPHPYIHQRNFTLIPLAEIAPDFVHPVLQRSNRELLNQSIDTAPVNLLQHG